MLLFVAAVLVGGGCGDSDSGTASERVGGFPPCPSPIGLAKPAAASGLPNLTLPCMDGSGRSVALGAPTGKPVVINLWGSWCPPCGRELPAFVRLDEATDDVIVMGVVTQDSAARARSAARELGVNFPNLYDREGKLRRGLGRNALPVTLFIDSAGQLKHTYAGPVLDDASLREAVSRYLGTQVGTAR